MLAALALSIAAALCAIAFAPSQAAAAGSGDYCGIRPTPGCLQNLQPSLTNVKCMPTGGGEFTIAVHNPNDRAALYSYDIARNGTLVASFEGLTAAPSKTTNHRIYNREPAFYTVIVYWQGLRFGKFNADLRACSPLPPG